MPPSNLSNLRRMDRLAVLFLMGYAAVRLLFAATFPLAADEAYYWQWSRHLDLGYYDQGPLIAWLIRLGTLILGDTELGVRLPGILANLGAGYVVYRYGRDILNDPGLGLALTLAYGASIIFGLGAVLATYDNPQNLFWLLVLYFTARALFRNEPWAWRPAGVAAGLGMLSKYSSVLLPGLVFLYLAAHPDRRTWLKRKEPWLAVLWAALVYAPNLYWNLAHGGAALRHTLAHTQGEWHVTTLDFLAEQAGMVGPILFVFLVIGWVRGIRSARRGSHPAAFLAWTSLPVFLLFLIISIKKRVYGNWAAPAYPAALLLAGMELWPLIRERKAWRRWGIASLVLGFGLMTLVFFHAPLVKALNPPLDRDPTNEVYGWPDLGPAMTRALKKWPGKEPPAFVFGVRYQIASLAAFYGPGQPRTACLFLPGERLNTYLYWHDIAALAGRDGVAVVDYPMNEATAALFESVQELAYVSLVNLTGRVGHDLGVYYCQGFKGKDARPEEFVGTKESRD